MEMLDQPLGEAVVVVLIACQTEVDGDPAGQAPVGVPLGSEADAGKGVPPPPGARLSLWKPGPAGEALGPRGKCAGAFRFRTRQKCLTSQG